jgi:hypothetical protein
LKSKTKELQSYLKPNLLHIVLLQHNGRQEALTLNKGIPNRPPPNFDSQRIEKVMLCPQTLVEGDMGE